MITKTTYGTIPAGEVDAYILDNGKGLKAEILTLGIDILFNFFKFANACSSISITEEGNVMLSIAFRSLKAFDAIAFTPSGSVT